METFFILYAILFILFLLVKGLASIGKGIGKVCSSEPVHCEERKEVEEEKNEKEEYESLVFDIKKHPDPQASFQLAERIILQLISINEKNAKDIQFRGKA